MTIRSAAGSGIAIMIDYNQSLTPADAVERLRPLDDEDLTWIEARDYILPDVMKIGGVTGWMRAAALGETHGIRLSNHLWPEISAQLLSATPTAHWLEYADWWNPILKEPLTIEDGAVRLDGVIGTGVEWNEAAVSRYAV